MSQMDATSYIDTVMRGAQVGANIRAQRESLLQRQHEFDTSQDFAQKQFDRGVFERDRAHEFAREQFDYNVFDDERSHVMDVLKFRLSLLGERRLMLEQSYRDERQAWAREDRAFEMQERDRQSAFRDSIVQDPPAFSRLNFLSKEHLANMAIGDVFSIIGQEVLGRGGASSEAMFAQMQIAQKRQEMMKTLTNIPAYVRGGAISELQAEMLTNQIKMGMAQLDKDIYVNSMMSGVDAIGKMPGVPQQQFHLLRSQFGHYISQGEEPPAWLTNELINLADVSSTKGPEWEIAVREDLRARGTRDRDIETIITRMKYGEPAPFRGGTEAPESGNEVRAKAAHEAIFKRLTDAEDRLAEWQQGVNLPEGDKPKAIKNLEARVAALRQQEARAFGAWDTLYRQRVGNEPAPALPTSTEDRGVPVGDELAVYGGNEPGVVAPREDARPAGGPFTPPGNTFYGPGGGMPENVVPIKGVGQADPERVVAALREWMAANPRGKTERNDQYKARAMREMAKIFGGG